MYSTTLTQVRQVQEGAAVDVVPPFLCCCSILNEALTEGEHLEDCELQQCNGLRHCPYVGSDISNQRESGIKRQKHRESMARQRQKLRESVDSLKQQEQELAQELQDTLDKLEPHPRSSAEEEGLQFRQAYVELVKEQLALQDERRNLEATWLQKNKYERFVGRERTRADDAARGAADMNEGEDEE